METSGRLTLETNQQTASDYCACGHTRGMHQDEGLAMGNRCIMCGCDGFMPSIALNKYSNESHGRIK